MSDQLDLVRKLVLDFLSEENVEIVLFGSRARDDDVSGSDVDVGVIPRNGWNERKLTLLREALEEANIIYKVDVVDLSKVSPDFLAQVSRDGIWWKRLSDSVIP